MSEIFTPPGSFLQEFKWPRQSQDWNSLISVWSVAREKVNEIEIKKRNDNDTNNINNDIDN